MCGRMQMSRRSSTTRFRSGNLPGVPWCFGELTFIEKKRSFCSKKQDEMGIARSTRSEEHTSELQSQSNLVCRLLLEKKKDADDCMPCLHVDALLPFALRVRLPLEIYESSNPAIICCMHQHHTISHRCLHPLSENHSS